MRTVVGSNRAIDHGSIDRLLELYVSWREECDAVRAAHRHWSDAARGERRLAHAGCIAALDREEHAAHAYADETARVTRLCA